jgi:DNA segregation ATPase FtsK/SpoIIIE, S-DNA-T family
MPHILIAGATGAGKSVCVNSIISSILFSKTPEDVRLILIDPKIVELKPYNSIPHLLVPVITDPKEAILVLKFLMFEMERRYSVLDQMGARDIVEYKSIRTKKRKAAAENFPFIVAIVDEFADLMSTSGKEAEILFARIAAKARAVGIHLVLATQRPSIDVITGLIKANIPARIAFQVISIQDSRIILDQKGADKLLGQGDMLYISPTQPFPTRLQGAFLSKNEVDQIADHWKNISPPNYINVRQILEDLKELNEEEDDGYYSDNNIDPLFQEAINIVFETLKASASYLQRRLSIGYNRAARMIEEMERMGIVGPQNGAKPREIIGSKPEL